MCVRGPALYKHGEIFRCFKIFFSTRNRDNVSFFKINFRAESISAVVDQQLFFFLSCGVDSRPGQQAVQHSFCVLFFPVWCLIYLSIYPLPPPLSSSSAVILNHTFHLQLYMHAVCQQRFAPIFTSTHHHQRFLFGRTSCKLLKAKRTTQLPRCGCTINKWEIWRDKSSVRQFLFLLIYD